ncbi:hypothetical protein [Endozoicomonas elysicola]|nr:hypothetical protein [Endozoicomonas elysicola]
MHLLILKTSGRITLMERTASQNIHQLMADKPMARVVDQQTSVVVRNVD